MNDFLYHRLPKNVGDEALQQQSKGLKELRLMSLQTDPDSFISRYEDEVNQPASFWLARLRPAAVEHFVAVDPSHLLTDSDISTATKIEAFLVFLKRDGPEGMVKEYSMEAIYVRPDQRGKGVCTRLIQESIKWASEDLHQTDRDEAIVYTTAAENNISAQRLYSKLGFEIFSRETIKDKVDMGREIVKMRLRLY